jgi:nitroreductase
MSINMNQIMANIKSRRSRRSFLQKTIPDEVIREIIEAGCYAPSALNKQPWKYIVIADEGSIRKLSNIVKEKSAKIAKLLTILKLFKPSLRDPKVVGAIKKTISSNADTVFYDAPLLIFIVSDKREPFAHKDCTLASQNMMLFAHSLGISSCYIGRAEILNLDKIAKEIIGLPARHRIQSAIVFGYSSQEEEPGEPKRRKDNIINWLR